MSAPVDPRRPVTREGEVPGYPAQAVYQQPVGSEQPLPAPVANQRNYSQSGNTQVETVNQSYYDPSGALVEKQEQVVDDSFTRRNNILDRTTQIMYFLVGMLEVLLGLRLLLRLINADSTSSFASFIYNLSAPFVAPFNGIFNNDQVLNQVGVIELSTILAMGIYALLAYGVVRLLYILFKPDRSSKEVYTASRRRRF